MPWLCLNGTVCLTVKCADSFGAYMRPSSKCGSCQYSSPLHYFETFLHTVSIISARYFPLITSLCCHSLWKRQFITVNAKPKLIRVFFFFFLPLYSAELGFHIRTAVIALLSCFLSAMWKHTGGLCQINKKGLSCYLWFLF